MQKIICSSKRDTTEWLICLMTNYQQCINSPNLFHLPKAHTPNPLSLGNISSGKSGKKFFNDVEHNTFWDKRWNGEVIFMY